MQQNWLLCVHYICIVVLAIRNTLPLLLRQWHRAKCDFHRFIVYLGLPHYYYYFFFLCESPIVLPGPTSASANNTIFLAIYKFLLLQKFRDMSRELSEDEWSVSYNYYYS